MKSVEIYKLTNTGEQEVLAVCSLVQETVICEGDESFISRITQKGIQDYSQTPPQVVFPSNGEQFLDQLPNNFHSGYVSAVLKEDE